MCKDCQEKIEELKKRAELKVKEADIYVRNHPYEAMGVAGAAGVLVGLGIGYLAGKHR